MNARDTQRVEKILWRTAMFHGDPELQLRNTPFVLTKKQPEFKDGKLYLDMLTVVECLLMLEEAFHIEIPDKEVFQSGDFYGRLLWTKLDDVIATVEKCRRC